MGTPYLLAPVTYLGIGQVTGFQIANAGTESFNVYNGDTTNVLLVSQQQTPQQSSSIPVQPLTNATITGRGAWYASAQSGKVSSVTVSSSAQLSPSPAQIAAQIALSGVSSAVPALIAAPVLVAGVGATFGPTIYSFPFGAAYMLVCNANTPTNACWADIRIQHLDTSGNVVYEEDYSVGIGSLGNFSPVIIRGNLEGNRLQISGTVATGAQINALPFGNGPFTGTGLILGVYSLAQAITPATPKIIPSNTTSGILQSFQALNLAAGTSSIVVPAFAYMGRVKWHTFSANPGNARASCQFFTVANGPSPNLVLRAQNDAMDAKYDEVEFLGQLCGFQVTNQAAAAANITSSIVAGEFI